MEALGWRWWEGHATVSGRDETEWKRRTRTKTRRGKDEEVIWKRHLVKSHVMGIGLGIHGNM